MVGASLESLLVSAGRAATAFIMRAIPTLLALFGLAIAIRWNGVSGAAVAVLLSSLLSVTGFWWAVRRHRGELPNDQSRPV